LLSNTHFAMAVHVLTALAYNAGKVVGSEELAFTVGTNPSFLRGLIGRLRDAGLVETRLGKGGGSLLGRPAAKISLLDVYRATETCSAMATHRCDEESICPVARGMGGLLTEVAGRLERAVETELKDVTIDELLATHIQHSA
jgi:Rrf2 family protein